MESFYESLDKQAHEYLIDHICLPCKLPQRGEYKETGSRLIHEPKLLSLMKNTLHIVRSELVYIPENFDRILRSFEEWCNLQRSLGLHKKEVHATINNSLQPNDFAVFYLHPQNACLILSMLPEDSEYSSVISCFQPSIDNASIMSVSGELSSSYPESSYLIKNKEDINSEIFARQIAALSKTEISEATASTVRKGQEYHEPRDVNSPKYVSEWLSAVASKGSPMSYYPIPIVKKITDDVLWKSADLPFRRSGMWTSIKVVLQLMLCNVYDQQYGKIVYKLVICFVIKALCQYPCECKQELLQQMIQKLAKKLYKLDTFPKDYRYDNLVLSCLQSCYETIQITKNKLVNILKQIVVQQRSQNAELDLSKIKISDKIYANLACRREIDRLKSIDFRSSSYTDKKPNSVVRNYVPVFPNLGNLSVTKEEDDIAVVLYDIECWVRYALDSFAEGTGVSIKEIFKILDAYTTKASEFYKCDPRGYSRMTLAVIHIICALDRIAAREIKLLLDYKIGIVSSEIFKYLLLPTQADMEYAYILRDYIDLRNAQSSRASVVDENNISINSFAARYYDQSPLIKQTRKKIEAAAQVDCVNKKEEFEEKIGTYRSYKEKYLSSSHEYSLDYSGRYHIPNCSKCRLERNMDAIGISQYEWPLPTCAICLSRKIDFLKEPNQSKIKCRECNLNKKLVMFELQIPECIAYLRDSLQIFFLKVAQGESSKSKVETKWIEQPNLSKFAKKYQKYIHMGSKTKSYLQTQYGRQVLIKGLSKVSQILNPNGLNLRLCDQNLMQIEFIVPYKHFLEKNFYNFMVIPPYQALQYSLTWITHNENQIISRQYQCPTTLKLSEFIKYGFFRAGGNLQMLNLLDAIETRGLTFNNESVYSLIAQSLWQLGLNSNADTLQINNFKCPTAHKECFSTSYMKQMAKSLQQYLEVISQNWSEHTVLLIIIIISARLISLSPTPKITDKMVGIIRQARNLCLDWKSKIESVLITEHSMTANDINSYKVKLLEICCFGILTYSIDKNNTCQLLGSSKDAKNWMQFMSKIYDIKILFRIIQKNLNVFQRNLMRMVIQCMIDIESQFKVICDAYKGKCLSEFALTKWAEAGNGRFESWSNYQGSYFYKCNFASNSGASKILLQVGIDGTFLVQGQPIGKLPKEILISPLYVSFFTNTDFDVQPGSGGVGTYITQNIPNAIPVSYTFFRSEKDFVIIEHREINGKRTNYQLIPRSTFKTCFPHSFIHDYSHWLDTSKQIIEFRATSFADKNYFSPANFQFDLNQKILSDTSGKRELIDINSGTFHEIFSKVMHRMELNNHIFIYASGNKISVELPRFKLSFFVKSSGQIRSHEFKGMIISKNQGLGTLFGLEQGLVLCENSSNSEIPIKKKLIVPHSLISVHKLKKDLHQAINIIKNEKKIVQNLEKDAPETVKTIKKQLRMPAFFCFEIDDRLKVLRAGESLAA